MKKSRDQPEKSKPEIDMNTFMAQNIRKALDAKANDKRAKDPKDMSDLRDKMKFTQDK